MNSEQAELYQRIQTFPLDEVDAALPFSQRLARDNSWTLEYANRAISEYKKFVFLAIAANHPVTPSDQVDQVWHLHLLYTHSYWEEFCSKILQTPLHHTPTQGGKQEQGKFNDWYNKTLESYAQLFDQSPPADIWHPAHVRFGQDIHFARINTQQNWVIPKPQLNLQPKRFLNHSVHLFLLLFLTLTIAGCEASGLTGLINPLHLPLNEFVGFYFIASWVVLLPAIFLSSLIWLRYRHWKASPLVFASFFMPLVYLGLIKILKDILTATGSDFLALYFAVGLIGSAFATSLVYWLDQRWLNTGLGQLQPDSRIKHFLEKRRETASFPFCLLVILGIARIGIGLYRGKPIGFLVILCIVALVIGVVVSGSPITISRTHSSSSSHHRRDRRIDRDGDGGGCGGCGA